MRDLPYFAPPGSVFPVVTADVRAAASRDEVEREQAFLRALGSPRMPKSELPVIREPTLPPDFAQQVAALDNKIFERGIPINSENLLELGRERFASLLDLARQCRVPREVTAKDLTSFESVQFGLGAFEASSVAPRKMTEQWQGVGRERDAVRRISDWGDLWKAIPQDPEPIAKTYAFHDAFESLVFGQSMLERLSTDGRLCSRFFCGGKGRKVDLSRDWLSVVEGSLVSVMLIQPTWNLLAWLSDEKSPPPSPVDLGKDFFNVRAPSLAQVQLAQAVLDGFALGYDGWSLWQFVGRRTRTVPEQSRLATWRTALARRYLAMTDFHAAVRVAFYRDVSSGNVYEAHREFDSQGYRSFVDQTVQKLLDQLSAVLALATEQTFPGSVLARFQGSLLCAGEAEARAEIHAHLAAAFPSANFQPDFTEL